jgi:hypothetical protein
VRKSLPDIHSTGDLYTDIKRYKEIKTPKEKKSKQ